MAAYQAALTAEVSLDPSTYQRREQSVRIASHATDRVAFSVLAGQDSGQSLTPKPADIVANTTGVALGCVVMLRWRMSRVESVV